MTYNWFWCIRESSLYNILSSILTGILFMVTYCNDAFINTSSHSTWSMGVSPQLQLRGCQDASVALLLVRCNLTTRESWMKEQELYFQPFGVWREHYSLLGFLEITCWTQNSIFYFSLGRQTKKLQKLFFLSEHHWAWNNYH